ncbi:MAG: hypothetical protein FWG68_07265 [Defluviitaleaceae bacterium]|nr:hypothetical protein [Defluviitaleaceae bacterium]
MFVKIIKIFGISQVGQTGGVFVGADNIRPYKNDIGQKIIRHLSHFLVSQKIFIYFLLFVEFML